MQHQEENERDRQQPTERGGRNPASQGVDQPPAEGDSTSKLSHSDLRGKKIDADPSEEKDRPSEKS